MKKYLLFLTLLLLPAIAHAYDVYINGIYYNLNNSRMTATVTKGDVSYQYKVSIPSSISVITSEWKIYTVNGIDEYAFENSNVSEVIIPNSVTYIGNWAFF